MLSDTLYEAVESIERDQKVYPDVYDVIKDAIDMVKETISDLQRKISDPAYVFGKAKCIVSGCSNHQHEGTFVGDICMPCFKYITTGVIGPTDSFLGELAGRQHCNCGRELLPGVCSVCDEKEEKDV